MVIPAVVVVLPLALLAVCVAVWRMRRDARLLLAALALIVYLAALVATTLFPLVIAPELAGLRVYLVPFGALEPSVFLNLLLTVPLGFLLPLALPRRRAGTAIVAGLAIVVGIELVQFVTSLVWGSSRVADINDVIVNTAGLLIGVLLVTLVRRGLRLVLGPDVRTPFDVLVCMAALILAVLVCALVVVAAVEWNTNPILPTLDILQITLNGGAVVAVLLVIATATALALCLRRHRALGLADLTPR